MSNTRAGSVGIVLLVAGNLLGGGCSKPPGGEAPSDAAQASKAVRPPNASSSEGTKAMLTIKSNAFSPNGAIPAKYTCQGGDSSPPLAWSGVPAGTQSLALIVDDPDAPDPAAPKRVWVHWVVFNLPPTVTELPEGLKELPAGAKSGLNDWQRTGYGGPCPPIGRHRYFHKLYALDRVLDLERPTKADVERAMQGHILGSAELIGTYQKS
jgi:hypothetical protein